MATPTATVPKAIAPNTTLIRYAWAVVAYNVLVVLWGSVVRSTGSGNGCGEHWPLCNGTVVQHWRTAASVIEFAHRASAGIDTLAILALLVWTWRATVKRHMARAFMGAAAVLTFNEALLGALLVKLGLTAQNHSPLRADYLSLHLANTLLLLGALALTAHFLARRSVNMRGEVGLIFPNSAALALGFTLLVGMSGALAALGDTLYPAHSLAAAFTQDFGPGAPWLLHLRWIHPALSLLAAVSILVLVMRPTQIGLHVAGAGYVLLLLLAQICLGIADVLLLAPTALQIAHLLTADLLWIALVVFAARLCVQPAGYFGSWRGRRRRSAPAVSDAQPSVR